MLNLFRIENLGFWHFLSDVVKFWTYLTCQCRKLFFNSFQTLLKFWRDRIWKTRSISGTFLDYTDILFLDSLTFLWNQSRNYTMAYGQQFTHQTFQNEMMLKFIRWIEKRMLINYCTNVKIWSTRSRIVDLKLKCDTV